jgi:tyrosinase
MERRQFLLATAGTLSAGSLSRIGAQPALPVRKSVNGLPATAPEAAQYAKAVGLLKKLPASDPRNWVAQARIHDGHCPHNNWWFLPWHRAYLYYFEQICRDVLKDQSFTLPYWDWSRAQDIPTPFLDKSSWLFDATRQHTKVDANILGVPKVVDLVGRSGLIDIFSGATSPKGTDQREDSETGELESGPHNHVHSTILGDMGTFMSPLDPIFWLHHCNIDRIWASWSRVSGHQPPSASHWTNWPLAEFYDPVAKKKVSPQVNLTLNEKNFGAVYDHYETPAGGSPLVTSLPSITLEAFNDIKANNFRRWAIDSDLTKGVTAGNAAQFAFEMTSGLNGAIQKAVKPAGATRNAEVYLYIEEVPAPESGSTAMRVFLNCKNPSLATPLTDPTYVGTICFFGAGAHAAAGHAATSKFALNITRTLSKVSAAGVYKANAPVDVALVPVDENDIKHAITSKIVRPGRIRLVGLEAM